MVPSHGSSREVSRQRPPNAVEYPFLHANRIAAYGVPGVGLPAGACGGYLGRSGLP